MQKEIGNYILDGNELGRGRYGIVFQGHEKSTKLPVAIKMIQRRKMYDHLVENEVQTLLKLNHPNIIRLYHFEKSESFFFLVFEYCEYGNLQDFLEKYFQNEKGMMPEYQVQKLFQQILSGLCAMNESHIVHRDLKLENILIGSNYIVKIADFGVSRFFEADLMRTYCGTPVNCAPEVLKGEEYDNRCDIWSLGTILYHTLFGHYPYYHEKMSLQGLINAMENENVFENQSRQVSKPVMTLLRSMLSYNVNERASFEDLKANGWLTGEALHPRIFIESQQATICLNGDTNWYLDTSPGFKSEYDKRIMAQQDRTKSDYILLGQISRQHSKSKVYSGIRSIDQKPVAIKVVNSAESKELISKLCSQEVSTLSQFDHPNIIKCLDYQTSPTGEHYLIYELCEHMDLESFVEKKFPNKIVPEHQAQKIFQQIICALKQLKDKKLIHRDLQLKNILVDPQFTLKLSDFQSAYDPTSQQPRSLQSTEISVTTPPELIEKGEYNETSYVWSLGVMIYQLLTGEALLKLPITKVEDVLKQTKASGWPQFPSTVSSGLKDLVTLMMTVDCGKRISFSDILNHPWFIGKFVFYRFKVSTQGMQKELAEVEYPANPWYPETDPLFKQNYSLISLSLSLMPTTTLASDKLNKSCLTF